MPVALITGSSTGIGLATAIHFARNGYETYATMRNLDSGGDAVRAVAETEGLPIRVQLLGVDEDQSVAAVVQAAVARSGQIDVLNAVLATAREIGMAKVAADCDALLAQ